MTQPHGRGCSTSGRLLFLLDGLSLHGIGSDASERRVGLLRKGGLSGRDIQKFRAEGAIDFPSTPARVVGSLTRKLQQAFNRVYLLLIQLPFLADPLEKRACIPTSTSLRPGGANCWPNISSFHCSAATIRRRIKSPVIAENSFSRG